MRLPRDCPPSDTLDSCGAHANARTTLNDARLWHPWLRINRDLRVTLRPRWNAETPTKGVTACVPIATQIDSWLPLSVRPWGNYFYREAQPCWS